MKYARQVRSWRALERRGVAAWFVGACVIVACGGDGAGDAAKPVDPNDAGGNLPLADGAPGPGDDGAAAQDGSADAGGDGPLVDPCKTPPSGKVVRVRGYNVLGTAGGVAADTAGNVWVTGQYTTNAPGGPYKFGALAAPSTTGLDGFVTRRDTSGTELWVQAATGAASDTAGAIATDAAGDAYVTGQSNSATLGIGGSMINRAFGTLGWLAKLRASDGAAQWLRGVTFNTTVAGQSGSCSRLVARGGSLFVACTANVSAQYVDTLQQPQTVQPISGNTLFVMRLDPATGYVMWVSRLGGTGGAFGRIVVTAAGDVVVVGTFYGPSVHDGPSACSAFHLGDTNSNLYIAQLTGANGTCTDVRAYGVSPAAPTRDGVIDSDVAIDGQGRLLVGGTFANKMSLGGTTLLQTVVPSGFNGFLASFATPQDSVPTWLRGLDTTLDSVAVDSCGRPAASVETTGAVSIDAVPIATGIHAASFDPTTQKALWARGILGDVNSAQIRQTGFATAEPGAHLLLVGYFSGMLDLGDGTPVGLGLGQQPFLVEYGP